MDRISRRRLLEHSVVGTLAGVLGIGTASGQNNGNNGDNSDENGQRNNGNQGTDHREVIVGLVPGHAGEVRRQASEVHRELDFGQRGEALSITVPEQALRGLVNNPNVRYIEENDEMEMFGASVPYGISLTDAYDAIDQEFTGEDVSIAILDTGIDPAHETLSENIGDGWAASDAECGTDDFWGSSSSCEEDWDDDNGHGTHVAGTAAAAMNDVGVLGVSPDATLHAVKVLTGMGSGSFDDIAAGIEWAVDNDLDVLNLSLGGPQSATVDTALAYAADNDAVIVAAAGNEGPDSDSVSSPASHPEVIAVSATDENDELADFSSRGPEVDIAAPGVDVLSTMPDDEYAENSGTSMAAPHVAGAAASVLSAGASNRDGVRTVLEQSADDIGLEPTESGNGRLNVLDAVDKVDDEVEEDEPPEDVTIDIRTDPATSVGDSTANLNGLLADFDLGDSDADGVEVWFEYGIVGTGFPNVSASAVFEEPTGFYLELTHLDEATHYEFRAHAAAAGLEKTGGVESFETDVDDGYCYVTTATARDHHTLNSLRRFRDDSMQNSRIGRALIRLYYWISPSIASTLEDHPDSRSHRFTRSVIELCATLSNRQRASTSRLEQTSLGVGITGLYLFGLGVATTGHVAIRAKKRLLDLISG